MLRAECSQHDARRSARKRGTCVALIIKVHGRYYQDAHRLPDGRTVAKNRRRRPADSGRKTVRRSTTTGVQGISPFSEDSYSLGLNQAFHNPTHDGRKYLFVAPFATDADLAAPDLAMRCRGAQPVPGASCQRDVLRRVAGRSVRCGLTGGTAQNDAFDS